MAGPEQPRAENLNVPFDQLSEAEKIERLRIMYNQMQANFHAVNDMFEKLSMHSHSEDGRVMIPMRKP